MASGLAFNSGIRFAISGASTLLLLRRFDDVVSDFLYVHGYDSLPTLLAQPLPKTCGFIEDRSIFLGCVFDLAIPIAVILHSLALAFLGGIV